MIARWEGHCAICSDAFGPGDRVTKDTEYGWVHAPCWASRLPEEPVRKQYHATAAYRPPARFRTKSGHRGRVS